MGGLFIVIPSMDGEANKFGSDTGCEAVQEVCNTQDQMDVVNYVSAKHFHSIL